MYFDGKLMATLLWFQKYYSKIHVSYIISNALTRVPKKALASNIVLTAKALNLVTDTGRSAIIRRI
jgi:hypothetical protein